MLGHPMNPSLLLRAALVLGLLACSAIVPAQGKEALQICADQTAVGLPEWIRSATIYEINVRQYSTAGNFAAVTADLPRLHTLGVQVLWLMPIHPIGETNRKGTLGSYYAVKDYLGVNPEFGSEADLHELITSAHAQGFHVILDWVGNHTAWDAPLAAKHPDFYVRDRDGHFQPPTGFDWTDVIQLDFSNPAVLDYQTAALTHWVRDFGVDGFRCDFATGVPTSYWNALFARLRAIRPDLFFLAESEVPQHQVRAFNASYAFDMMQALNAVAQGRAGASHVDEILARKQVRFPAGASLLYYTSNHDENSWQGTEYERLGGGTAPFAVLSFMLDGIPLIYNGQEIGLNRRLNFFERDPITWVSSQPLTSFYQKLCGLRATNPALRTGSAMRRILTTQDDAIYALLREASGQRVIALLNLTARDVTADVYEPRMGGKWQDVFSGETLIYSAASKVELRAWAYRVLVAVK